MKFNWGTGIALFYTLFVLVLVFTVYRSTKYDHSLVSDHYYADDLAYQQHYNKLRNAQQLREDLKIWNKIQKSEVELQFPAEFSELKGEVYFFCPSDSKRDFKVKVNAGSNNVQSISTRGLRPGMWRIKVNWEGGGRQFYKEESITI